MIGQWLVVIETPILLIVWLMLLGLASFWEQAHPEIVLDLLLIWLLHSIHELHGMTVIRTIIKLISNDK